MYTLLLYTGVSVCIRLKFAQNQVEQSDKTIYKNKVCIPERENWSSMHHAKCFTIYNIRYNPKYGILLCFDGVQVFFVCLQRSVIFFFHEQYENGIESYTLIDRKEIQIDINVGVRKFNRKSNRIYSIVKYIAPTIIFPVAWRFTKSYHSLMKYWIHYLLYTRSSRTKTNNIVDQFPSVWGIYEDIWNETIHVK